MNEKQLEFIQDIVTNSDGSEKRIGDFIIRHDYGANLYYEGAGGDVIVPEEAANADISDTFANAKKITALRFPGTFHSISVMSFGSKATLQSLIFDEGVERLPETNFFDTCKALESVILPQSLQYLGAGAFKKSPWYQNNVEEEGGCCYLGRFLVDSDEEIESAEVRAGTTMKEFLKLRGEIKPTEKKEYLQLAESLKKSNITALLSNDASQKAPTPTKKKESPNMAELKYNWSFKKKEDGTILITAYKGKDTEITIPERIGKDIVTEIGDNAFSPGAKRIQNADVRTGITSVVVPDTVTALGDQAFNGCRSLRTIKLPESLVKMGMSVFSGCGKLETLRLPDGLTGKLVLEFMYCRSLKQVYIPDGITSIGMSSFEMCEALEELHVGAGMQSIGYHVLGDAERVTIYAPAGSYAEQFAKENGIHFVAEQEEPQS